METLNGLYSTLDWINGATRRWLAASLVENLIMLVFWQKAMIDTVRLSTSYNWPWQIKLHCNLFIFGTLAINCSRKVFQAGNIQHLQLAIVRLASLDDSVCFKATAAGNMEFLQIHVSSDNNMLRTKKLRTSSHYITEFELLQAPKQRHRAQLSQTAETDRCDAIVTFRSKFILQGRQATLPNGFQKQASAAFVTKRTITKKTSVCKCVIPRDRKSRENVCNVIVADTKAAERDKVGFVLQQVGKIHKALRYDHESCLFRRSGTNMLVCNDSNKRRNCFPRQGRRQTVAAKMSKRRKLLHSINHLHKSFQHCCFLMRITASAKCFPVIIGKSTRA